MKEEAPLEPPQLCGLIGLLGSGVIAAHAAVFTYPRRAPLTAAIAQRHRDNMYRTLARSYGGKTLTDFCHGWAYFHLMGHLGATSMSVMKGAVAASSFATSVVFFCAPDCCVADELSEGATCPATGPAQASSFFCHYSPAQCFSAMKALSLVLVVAGVLLYNARLPGRGTRIEASEEEREALAKPRGTTSVSDSDSLLTA